ncbi:hypothetical protein HD806DRAFT_528411 [Xylariaceae sp. AK1471]|nr:hypothetical protein HD806DRAFT_528411 [Xylariaceae sp. AK1471]
MFTNHETFSEISSLLHFPRKMRAVPESDRLRGTLDLISLEDIARNLAADVLANIRRPQRIQEHGLMRGVVTYVHQAGDLDIPLFKAEHYLERGSSG